MIHRTPSQSITFLLLPNLFYEVLTFFCFVFYPILSDNEKTRKPSIRSQLTDSNLQLMHRKYIIEKCFMLRVVGVPITIYSFYGITSKTKLNFIILSNDPVSHQPENGYCCGCTGRERRKRFCNLCTLRLKKDDFAQCSLGRVISQCISYH